MKTRILILAFLFACISLCATAQPKIFIMGYAYTEEGNKQTIVPFATISVYDYNQPNELKYFTTCGPYGNYTIRPYDHTKKYRFVVEASGYKIKEFNLEEIPEVWKGKPFSGNRNVNIPLIKDKNTSSTIRDKKYTIAMLKKEAKVKTITDLLHLIPEIRKEGNDWITAKGEGSVCLFLNGIVAAPQTLAKLDKLPVDGVTSIDYYQLGQGGLYDATINISLIVGKPATAPTDKLSPSPLMFY